MVGEAILEDLVLVLLSHESKLELVLGDLRDEMLVREEMVGEVFEILLFMGDEIEAKEAR